MLPGFPPSRASGRRERQSSVPAGKNNGRAKQRTAMITPEMSLEVDMGTIRKCFLDSRLQEPQDAASALERLKACGNDGGNSAGRRLCLGFCFLGRVAVGF